MGQRIIIILVKITTFLLNLVTGNKECIFTDARNEYRPEWFQIDFPENYNKRLAPKKNGCPAEVNVAFTIWKIGQMKFEEMTFQADFFIKLQWNDYRLNIPQNTTNQIALSDKEAALVWLPVFSFRNAVGSDGVSFDLKTHKLKLLNQSFLYISRHVINFHCNYDLSAFPMDTQRCTIEVQNSAGDNKYVMTLTDKSANYKLFSNSFPPDFEVTSMSSGPCTREDGMSEYRSCVEYSFVLHRYLSFHFMTTYAPSIIIVILSWLSFWLGSQCTPPRVALGVTSLLTLTTQFANVQRNLPPVAYVKSIDIWMFVCMLQVFGTLVEFTIMNYTIQHKQKSSIQNNKIRQCGNIQLKLTALKSRDAAKEDSRIDKLSRIVFPLSFAVFNFIYWSYYLSL